MKWNIDIVHGGTKGNVDNIVCTLGSVPQFLSCQRLYLLSFPHTCVKYCGSVLETSYILHRCNLLQHFTFFFSLLALLNMQYVCIYASTLGEGWTLKYNIMLYYYYIFFIININVICSCILFLKKVKTFFNNIYYLTINIVFSPHIRTRHQSNKQIQSNKSLLII